MDGGIRRGMSEFTVMEIVDLRHTLNSWYRIWNDLENVIGLNRQDRQAELNEAVKYALPLFQKLEPLLKRLQKCTEAEQDVILGPPPPSTPMLRAFARVLSRYQSKPRMVTNGTDAV